MQHDASTPGGLEQRVFGWLPRLEREDRLDLLERLELGSTWNADFTVMMGLSTALASLGLLQDSVAVVIGAMLVAPLMTPLIAAGFALIQGNARLFGRAFRTMLISIGVGLFISLLAGLFAPGYDLTVEIEARGEVNAIDIGVALVSGMAAAYAMARLNVASTLAGVAIAAALVPPLSVIGIALSHGRPVLAGLAAVLLSVNLVCIAVGAAIVFRLMGVAGARGESLAPLWVRRTQIALLLVIILLAAPLIQRMLMQARIGQKRPLLYPVSHELRSVVRERIEREPGVRLMLMARSSPEPEEGVGIMIVTRDPVRPGFEAELTRIVRNTVGEATPVRIFALLDGHIRVQEETEEAEAAADAAGER
ncbi:MAG: DUF389 domain-containing protein [Planctomycetota bacterium]|jgi:uncharacterized hydrophobic protein (TIGR00271 family)